MKKFLSTLFILLCLCSMATAMEVPAVMSRNIQLLSFDVEENFQYTERDGAIYLTKYVGTDPYVDIPTKWEGKEVYISKTIKNANGTYTGPFAQNPNIILVNAVSGVRVEDNNADYMFYGCTSLTVAPTLHYDVTTMRSTYYGCTALRDCESLPPSLLDLTAGFQGCENLQEMPVLPNSLINITYSFKDCKSLTTIRDLPPDAADLSGAFQNCTQLTGEITLTNNVTSVYLAFDKAGYFITVKVKNDSPVRYAYYPDNVILLVDGEQQWQVVDRGSYTEGVKYLGTNPIVKVPTSWGGKEFRMNGTALKGNTVITKVTFGESALCSSQNATGMFEGCIKLTEVLNLPNNIKHMERGFSGCTALVKAPVLPTSVETVVMLYADCVNMTDPGFLPPTVGSLSYTYSNTGITKFPSIPPDVKSLDHTFNNCKNLTGSVQLGDSIINAENAFYGTVKNIYLMYPISNLYLHEMSVPKNVEKYPNYTTDWQVTDNGMYISGDRYIGNSSKVYVPVVMDGRDFRIAPSAFRGNFNITEVIFQPSAKCSVTTATELFYNCSNLQKVTNIPSNIYYMDRGFMNCTQLVSPPSLPKELRRADYLFQNCSNLTSPGALPDTMESLRYTYTNTSITSLPVIPDNVTEMYGTFFNCQSAKGDVVMPEGLVYAESVFDQTQLPITMKYYINCTAARDLVVPNNVIKSPMQKSDWQYVIQEDGSITVLKYIGTNTSVVVPAMLNGNPWTYYDSSKVFVGNEHIIDVKFQDGVKMLDNYASYLFSGCINLISVENLPDDITTIDFAFENCHNLVDVPFVADSVTSAYYAFQDCWNITQISQPLRSLINVDWMFVNCRSLYGDIEFGEGLMDFKSPFYGTERDINLIYHYTNDIIASAELPGNVTRSPWGEPT